MSIFSFYLYCKMYLKNKKIFRFFHLKRQTLKFLPESRCWTSSSRKTSTSFSDRCSRATTSSRTSRHRRSRMYAISASQTGLKDQKRVGNLNTNSLKRFCGASMRWALNRWVLYSTLSESNKIKWLNHYNFFYHVTWL